MPRVASTYHARLCYIPVRKTSRAGKGLARVVSGGEIEIFAEAADASADLVSDLLVEDTENFKSENTPSENKDLEQLQELYDLMQAESLESVELQDQDTRIRLQRARKTSSHEGLASRSSAGRQHQDPAPGPQAASESSSNAQQIVTPLAGVFYRASSPTNPPYVQEGSVVEPGQTLCIIEAMKVMNEIKAESRCRIVKILAENARPVNAGQALFHVEPA
jgi:acetyl-CoA carboxylase biotin carboxyl carrier protein